MSSRKPSTRSSPRSTDLGALEKEKSQTLGLSGMLEESRAAYDTLRTEFYQIERKATALERIRKLREDLELSRESNAGWKAAQIELTNDINARNSQIGQLERNLAQESASAVRLENPAAPCRISSTAPKAHRPTRRRIGRRAREIGAA